MTENTVPDARVPNPRQNRVLAALPANELARLADELEFVGLAAGEVLVEPGDSPAYVYFPTTCVVSLIFSTENGSLTELAMTGNDGVVGLTLVLGGETTTHKLAVQRAGGAYRLRADTMSWQIGQGGTLQRLALCYVQALMTQMAQSVVCHRHHAVDQQLCRWLLLSLDLQRGNQLDVTQELIASKLGVRREGITEAAGKLQADGLIEYHRGHITVLDRAGLEAQACECYGVVRAEYERLFRLNPAEPLERREGPNPAAVRRRAAAHLQQRPPTTPRGPWDAERLLHEMQAHQIELEMRIEELSDAHKEADALRAQLADIYDFAPLAYFTLDALGVIRKVNLAGAILLGIKRSEHERHRFAAFVKPECLAIFNRFQREVFEAKSKKKCELVLMANDHRPETVVRVEAVSDEPGNECRMVVSVPDNEGVPRHPGEAAARGNGQ